MIFEYWSDGTYIPKGSKAVRFVERDAKVIWFCYANERLEAVQKLNAWQLEKKKKEEDRLLKEIERAQEL